MLKRTISCSRLCIQTGLTIEQSATEQLLDEESELVVVLECYTRTTRDREQRCFGYVERNSDLILESLGESVELCTTTCEVDSALDDIGVKLRRC